MRKAMLPFAVRGFFMHRPMLIVVCGLMTLSVGCKIFSKGNDKPSGSGTTGIDPNRRFWDQNDPGSRPSGELTDGSDSASKPTIVSGYIIDKQDRRLSGVFVQAIPVSEDGTPTAKKSGVESKPDGSFLIEGGVFSKRTYLITAQKRVGERMLGGAVQVTAPNANVVIVISEENFSSLNTTPPTKPNKPSDSTDPPKSIENSSDTPVDPLSSGNRKPNPPKPSGSEAPAEPTAVLDPDDQAFGPGKAPPPPQPVRQPYPPPPTKPLPRPDVTRVAQPNTDNPPIVNINGPRTPPKPNPTAGRSTNDPPPAPNGSRNPVLPTQQTPASSAPSPAQPTVSGGGIQNFTLFSPYGTPWEFVKRFGRLTLIEFMSSNCPACRQAAPKVDALFGRHRGSGLEVIAVLCDQGPWKSRVARAIDLGRYSYPILLEGDNTLGTLQQQFAVPVYPTFILLDRSGQEIANGTHLDLKRLEAIIAERLRSE